MSDLTALTATRLVAGYASGDLSPLEATRAVLERAEEIQPRVNAFVRLDEEEALDQARASEERWRRGAPQGLLDGVPVTVKDMLLQRGAPTLRGSWSVPDDAGPYEEDAPSVARMREHGAVFVGKTTTPEFGWKGVTDNPRDGVTGNPYDAGRTAGGSSGGSAAAVALGAGPLSLGTDAGGSVRIPASFSGIFALKPTYGRVPLYPASAFGTLAHVGPMTRDAADAALLMDVSAAADPRDWSQLGPHAGQLPRPAVGGPDRPAGRLLPRLRRAGRRGRRGRRRGAIGGRTGWPNSERTSSRRIPASPTPSTPSTPCGSAAPRPPPRTSTRSSVSGWTRDCGRSVSRAPGSARSTT